MQEELSDPLAMLGMSLSTSHEIGPPLLGTVIDIKEEDDAVEDDLVLPSTKKLGIQEIRPTLYALLL